MGVTVLDAGVLIAALDDGDLHYSAAVTAMREAAARSDTFVLPASAYAELLVRPSGQGNAAVTRVDTALDGMGVTIAPADRSVARRAAHLRARHRSLRLPDALLIATAEELAAEHLVTTDARWARLPRSARPRGLVVLD